VISVEEAQKAQRLCDKNGWKISHGEFGECNLVSEVMMPDNRLHRFIKATLVNGIFIDSMTGLAIIERMDSSK
jgi:hypothetical protein